MGCGGELKDIGWLVSFGRCCDASHGVEVESYVDARLLAAATAMGAAGAASQLRSLLPKAHSG